MRFVCMKNEVKQVSARSRMLRWCSIYLTERPLVFILAATVGLGAGCMAWLLKMAIRYISELVIATVHSVGPNWWLIVVPAVGILIVVFLLYKVFRVNVAHGVRHMQSDMEHHISYVPAKITYIPLVTSAITLGCGGSAGAEGPIAYSGAALGSTVSRLFKLSAPMAMLMTACGAGAGIAAIFKAPIGGALFTLEVLRMSRGAYGTMVLFVATLFAGLTATALGGFNLDMVFTQAVTYHTSIIPWAILLGLFCGLYSLYYSYIMKLVGNLLDLMKNRWIKGVVAGVLLGVTLLLFPALYGEGYDVMGKVLNGDFSAMTYGTVWNDGIDNDALRIFVIGLCILLIKCFSTSLSYNGGGVTGEFAPTLFAGCFAGYVFGTACNWLFGADLPVGQLAFMGMAGVMAGAIRAPFMAMFIVVEMSSAYSLLLPLAIVSGISFGVMRLFTSDSFFSKEMDRNNGVLHFIKAHTHRKA